MSSTNEAEFASAEDERLYREDLRIYGVAFLKDGHRISPWRVFIEPPVALTESPQGIGEGG